MTSHKDKDRGPVNQSIDMRMLKGEIPMPKGLLYGKAFWDAVERNKRETDIRVTQADKEKP